MTRLPRLQGKELVRVLERSGFRVIRIRAVTLFLGILMEERLWCRAHSGEVIGPGLLRAILRDVEISPEEFRRYL